MKLTQTLLALAATTTTALAAPHTNTPAYTTTPSPKNSSSSSTAYSLTTSYSGSTFFDNFSFFTNPDPTNGFVNYTSRSLAASSGLVGLIHNLTSKKDTAYIGVDYNTTTTTARNSVRLIGEQKFNAGSMAVIDVRHIPVQNGVWPAIWMLGSEGIWPSSGESDILEYVHMAEANAVTLHTAPGFIVDNTTEAFQGQLVDGNCNAVDATKGCSITMEHNVKKNNRSAGLATAGEAFNQQGGGVYVHDWTKEGITVWLFPRDDLPADLVAGHPDSSTWTRKPIAKFTTSGNGDFGKTFKEMQLIINIDFCGDWAGKPLVWEESGAKEATGMGTCAEYVGANPGDFKEAYFEIGSIDFYSKDADAPATYGTDNDNDNGNEKRTVAGVKTHYGHHHAVHKGPPHSNARTHDAPAKRSAAPTTTTSDASAMEVGGWMVGAGMFLLIAAFI